MTNQIPFSYFRTYVSAYSMSFLHSCQDSQVCSKHIILEFRHSQTETAGQDQDLENWPGTIRTVEACVAEWLTPQTLDLEVQGSSLACGIVPLDKEL